MVCFYKITFKELKEGLLKNKPNLRRVKSVTTSPMFSYISYLKSAKMHFLHF